MARYGLVYIIDTHIYTISENEPIPNPRYVFRNEITHEFFNRYPSFRGHTDSPTFLARENRIPQLNNSHHPTNLSCIPFPQTSNQYRVVPGIPVRPLSSSVTSTSASQTTFYRHPLPNAINLSRLIPPHRCFVQPVLRLRPNPTIQNRSASPLPPPPPPPLLPPSPPFSSILPNSTSLRINHEFHTTTATATTTTATTTTTTTTTTTAAITTTTATARVTRSKVRPLRVLSGGETIFRGEKNGVN